MIRRAVAAHRPAVILVVQNVPALAVVAGVGEVARARARFALLARRTHRPAPSAVRRVRVGRSAAHPAQLPARPTRAHARFAALARAGAIRGTPAAGDPALRVVEAGRRAERAAPSAVALPVHARQPRRAERADRHCHARAVRARPRARAVAAAAVRQARQRIDAVRSTRRLRSVTRHHHRAVHAGVLQRSHVSAPGQRCSRSHGITGIVPEPPLQPSRSTAAIVARRIRPLLWSAAGR